MGSAQERAVEVLCTADLAHVVDLVAWPEGEGPDRVVLVANAAGAARLGPDGAEHVLHGRSPVAKQDPMAFASYESQLEDPSPPNERHAYPYAAVRLHSFFADPRSPDVAVVHSAAHFFPERGGHLGEHGSLNAVQSRAPLLVSGQGVEARGVLDDHARTVDVGPTLAHLAGVPLDGLAGLDGRARTDLATGTARHVLGLLWDGVNAADLLHLVELGELPGVARLLERGCALGGGAVAEFPSLTLVNHTSALTGLGPGRHGVVGNVYRDRSTGARVVPNDSTTWHRSAEWLRPGVRTVFELVAAARPAARTASVDEPVDRGATYSTMALLRESPGGGAVDFGSMLPDPRQSPYASKEWVDADAGYARWSAVDEAGLAQVMQLFETAATAPLLTWWNTTLTDAAHHAGGPRSQVARAALSDSDRRLEVLLDRLDALGLTDETTVLLTSDHGFEAADPECQGDWGRALHDAGIAHVDEGPGMLYLEGDG